MRIQLDLKIFFLNIYNEEILNVVIKRERSQQQRLQLYKQKGGYNLEKISIIQMHCLRHWGYQIKINHFEKKYVSITYFLVYNHCKEI